MEFKVLSSGSKANGYILKGENESLVLEAGVPVKEALKAVDYRINSIQGVLVSHRHGDHSIFLNQYLKKGMKVYASEDVLVNRGAEIIGFKQRIVSMKTFQVGGFIIIPFDVTHDVPTHGFYVSHKEMGNLVFMTDAFLCEYSFPNVSHWIVEANYSDEILGQNISEGAVHFSMKDRLYGSHMELDKTCQYLEKQDLETARTVVLIHLSERNSDPGYFEKMVRQVVGVPVYAAKSGLTIDISKNIF